MLSPPTKQTKKNKQKKNKKQNKTEKRNIGISLKLFFLFEFSKFKVDDNTMSDSSMQSLNREFKPNLLDNEINLFTTTLITSVPKVWLRVFITWLFEPASVLRYAEGLTGITSQNNSEVKPEALDGETEEFLPS